MKTKTTILFILALSIKLLALNSAPGLNNKGVLNCIPPITISASGTTVCHGNSVTFTASGADTYTWNPGMITAPVLTVSPFFTSIYTVTGTNSLGCVSSATIKVVVNPNPVISALSPSQFICTSESGTLFATGALTYTWSTMNTTVVSATVVATSSVAGTFIYSVTGQDANGCKANAIVPVNFQAGPIIIPVNSSNTLCSGTTATVTGTGALSYSWSNGSTSSAINIAPLTTATYTVYGVDGNGCMSTKTLIISVVPAPTLAINDYTICPGGTVNLTASGATNYLWSNGSNFPSIIVSPTVNTNYTITGSNSNCMDTKTISVTIGNVLSVYISPPFPSVCSGSSITLNASGGTSYSWTPSGTSGSITVNPTLATIYTVSAVSGTCMGTQTVYVAINPNPVTLITSTNVSCFGGNNGKINPASIGAAPYSYTYSGGSPDNLFAGVYTVTTKDNNNCIAINTISITQPVILTAAIVSHSTSCALACDGSVTTNASGGALPYSFSLSPSVINGSLCAGSYSSSVTDANGCQTAVSFTIDQGNTNLLVLTNGTNPGCGSCSDGSITATSTNGSGPYSYTWMPGNSNSNPLTNLTTGCYTVNVNDSKGCTGLSSICLSFDVGGLNQNFMSETITIVPNPNKGAFTLEFTDGGSRQIEITDVLGKLIRTINATSNTVPVDMGFLNDGIYYAKITSEKKPVVVKVVKN